jgi:hypothetical protein
VIRLFHIALFLAGALAIYIGAFAYNKGIRIGNKLDDWWGRPSSNRNDVNSLVSSFFLRVAGAVEIWLIRCFMEEEFSAQWIIVCASLPLVSFIWTLILLAGAANLNHPAKWVEVLENDGTQQALIAALALLPIAFAVAFVFKFFLLLVRGIAQTILASLVFTGRGVASTLRGDFTIQFPSQRLARIWDSIRAAPASWRIPSGLKAWVVALHAAAVWLMAFCAMVFMAFVIPLLLLVVLALTLPGIALWFGGLGWLELRILPPDLVKLSKPAMAAVIAAGILPAASCLFTLRWIFSLGLAVRSNSRPKVALTLFVLLLSFLLCFGPFFVFHGLRPANATGKFPVGSAFIFVALCNGFNVLIASGLIGSALLLIVHRRIWPRLRHWLMALRLAGVIFSRRFYVAAGLLLLITSAAGWNLWRALFMRPELYEKLAKLVEHVAGWF